jgi:hypothetical protein
MTQRKAESDHPLKFEIIGGPRTPHHEGSKVVDTELYDVEWRRVDGKGFEDHVLLPDEHPVVHPLMAEARGGRTDIKHKKVKVGEREVVKDTISVPAGSAKSVVMQMCEEKKDKLAETFGLKVPEKA